jgi:hypothetical protein
VNAIEAKIVPVCCSFRALTESTQINCSLDVVNTDWIIFTHDLGKLQVKWQQVMRGWQAIAHSSFQGRNPGKHLLAHTDYDPEEKQQRDALKAYEAKHKRPKHAIESAFLTQEILKKSLLPLLHEYLQLYLLVVRALRLCDQRSVQLEQRNLGETNRGD